MLDIAAWQCCQCNFPQNPIVDSNAAWFSNPRVRERCANSTHHYNIRGAACQCPHYRCPTCIDLSIDGRMLRYCDGVRPIEGGPMPPRWTGHVTAQDPHRPMSTRTRAALQHAVRMASERSDTGMSGTSTMSMGSAGVRPAGTSTVSMGSVYMRPVGISSMSMGSAGMRPVGGANEIDLDIDSSSDTAVDSDGDSPSLHLARQSLMVRLPVPEGVPNSNQSTDQGRQGLRPHPGQQADDQVRERAAARGAPPRFHPVGSVVYLPGQDGHPPRSYRVSQPSSMLAQRSPPVQQAQQPQPPTTGSMSEFSMRGGDSPGAPPRASAPATEGGPERPREFSPDGRLQLD